MDMADHSLPTPPTGLSTPQRPPTSLAELSPPSSQHGHSAQLSGPSNQTAPINTNNPNYPSTSSGPPTSTTPSISSLSGIGANVNGKRPISTIDDTTFTSVSDGQEQQQQDTSLTGVAGGVAGVVEGDSTVLDAAIKGAQGSQFANPEDEPGFSWKSKRAQDEYVRALEGVMKDRSVGNRYGDPFEMAEKEAALGLNLD